MEWTVIGGVGTIVVTFYILGMRIEGVACYPMLGNQVAAESLLTAGKLRRPMPDTTWPVREL